MVFDVRIQQVLYELFTLTACQLDQSELVLEYSWIGWVQGVVEYLKGGLEAYGVML